MTSTHRLGVQWDNDFLLLDFDDDDNTSPFGKEIKLGQVVDNLESMNVVWYKFEGLEEKEGSSGVSAYPYLYLDLSPSSDGVFDVRVVKEMGSPSRWVPLPVDSAPQSGTVWPLPPLGPNWRYQSGRRITSLHAKIRKPNGDAAVFSRCCIELATRSVLGTTAVGGPHDGERFSSTTLPFSNAIKK